MCWGSVSVRRGSSPLAAQHDQHAVLALVAEEHLDPGDLHRRLQPLDDDARLGVGDAPGAAVGDGAVGVERGEVAAGGDVAGSELEVEPGGRERAPAELELPRGRSRTARGGRAPSPA